MKWFAGVKTVEELRKKYRELLKKYHPDNPNGSVEATQEINREYDRLFADLQRSTGGEGKSSSSEEEAQNEAFKAVLNEIINFNMRIEIIGEWIWAFDSFNYKERLKELGFKYAPRKKAWTWHHGEYHKRHKKEITLDEIRSKYGSKTVNRKSRQCALN